MKPKVVLPIALGALVMLTALWGGAYAIWAFDDWREFPSFMTAFVAFIGGFSLIGLGCMNTEE
jgi:hypothetical protein